MVPPPLPAHAGFRRGAERLAYNERAFRYFLTIDRARAIRSRRCLYLVLIALRQGVGRRAPFSDAAAASVFRALVVCLREIDFVGWYQERHVAGAVLAQTGGHSAGVMTSILNRLVAALKKELPPVQARELRVRMIRLGHGGGDHAHE